MNVKISGLGAGTSLGVYDLNLGFNPILLSYNGTTFGNQLDLFGLGDIQSATPSSGSINLFELSLESVSDLNSLQSAAFTLATLNFTASATKVGSPLTLSLNALGDASGNSITVYLQDGLVTIEQPSGVPEPSSLLYSILGIFILAVRTRTFRR